MFPWQKKVIHWIFIIFTTYSVGYFFFAVFQCGITTGGEFFEKRISGTCAKESAGLGLGYIHSILTAGTDLIYVFLPIPMINQSTLRFREKIVVGGILIVGTM
jgi:hypothetical protein